ncbi:Vta1 like-domain-containing protein [Xylariaceae sp. FL0662B]|nr:Vta1 like-domain-containing protein [Xylariaceae sp. FL0662B]
MATGIPATLKQAGITPFVVRATQLEAAKPVIAYWCQYWVVNQILKKQLHTADQECLQFTTNLMDRLEQIKNEQAGNDAILDDVAGQAYVEQFAQETFERALRPLKANKVTQQTANTFEAAATFFQLVNIWGQADAETQEKIKYAKWNAARILKAIKEGKDPNESNPKQGESKKEEERLSLDSNDPEVQMIRATQPRPASVEDVLDEDSKLRPAPTGYSQTAAAPVSPTSPPSSAPKPEQVSPIAPPEPPNSELGSYFPDARPSSSQTPLDLPSTTSMPPPGSSLHNPMGPPPSIPSPSSHDFTVPPPVPFSPPNVPSAPQDFYRPAPPPPGSTPTPPPIPRQQPQMPPPHSPQAPAASQNYYSQRPSHPVAPAPAQQPTSRYTGTDDMAMAEAQKHAKWAISALNFEDVDTAVRELQAALTSLGAR